MTSFRLVLNSLVFHWRTHLAVLLGVIAGTAVIGGALIVGDSVRESLKTISLKRLGGVDFAVQSPRFFRESLAAEISDAPEFQKSFSSLAPALSMTAGLQRHDKEQIHRANRVGFWGVDERFWPMIAPDSAPVPQDRDIVLGSETAKALEAKVGDQISVWVELP
ncbi:MAG TPA: hypothetical protein VLA12_20655, partial [Planctomycetaceae bacterium]|nr:hypothetical protein [Planctomycetaceae bacterium]